MKYDPIGHLRRAFATLRTRATASVRRFGHDTDAVLSEEPIDFSAPSIPYYENLATRMSFVRVVLYMILFVFVVVTVISNHTLITHENLYVLAMDIHAANKVAHAEVDHISYPISATEADITSYRGGLVIAGSDVVTAISASGKETLSVNVDYAKPTVRASEKLFLTFGLGECSYAVYNSFAQVHRERTEYPVFDAAVADDGTYAILTRSRDYNSEVILYDDDMEQLAAYRIGGYVTGMAINPAGTCLGVVSVESKAGIWETRITLIRIERRITMESVTFTGTSGALCGFTSDERFAVVLSDRLLVLKNDATITREVALEGKRPVLGAIADGHIAILARNEQDLTADTVYVYDRNGDLDYTHAIGRDHPTRPLGGAEFITLGGGKLYIRAADALFCVDDRGNRLTAASISRDASVIIAGEDGVYVCTMAYAKRLSENDFE